MCNLGIFYSIILALERGHNEISHEKLKKEVGLSEDVSLSDFSWSERDRADGKR